MLALGANSTKFCTHNLWATRRLEMEKLGVGGEDSGECRKWGAVVGGPGGGEE